jgi:hypothetical protein
LSSLTRPIKAGLCEDSRPRSAPKCRTAGLH